MPTEVTWIAIVSACIAGGALIANIISAISSARSAAASEKSSNAALRNLQRTAVRELALAIHRCSSEAERISHLISELEPQQRALAIHSGNFGGSGQSKFSERMTQKQKRAEELALAASALSNDLPALRNASIEDLTEKLAEVDSAVSKLIPLREGLEREQERVIAMLETYQSKVIQGK